MIDEALVATRGEWLVVDLLIRDLINAIAMPRRRISPALTLSVGQNR